ncbi:MAG: glycoside hydrolase family 32 protein [Planctomycetota bacterium]
MQRFTLCALLTLVALAIGSPAGMAEEPDILIADFEGESYGDWKVQGTAFGEGPARGTLPRQMPVSGYLGKGLVNSFVGRDAAKGVLTSPPFEIRRDYINFLIGGGMHPGHTCVNLQIDGKTVRTATGPNDRPGGSERLDWTHWDVREFKGQTASIEIVDQQAGGWGHINVDQIVQANVARQPEQPPIERGRLTRQGKEADYKSKVPQYEFADTLAEQEGQLLTNPLLKRFAESRKRNLEDRFHPRYHYVAPENRMNDPNGLCYWQGRWHLFYQGYPPEDPRQHWGHVVSNDLIHWRDLPYAIYPDPERCCYSGATLVEADRVIAMYHGTNAGNLVAVSSDPLLLNWEKVTGKPVIPMMLPDGSKPPYRVFDPCIWKKGDMYYALSGGQLPSAPGGKQSRANFLFRSADLAHWEYLHPFVEHDKYSLDGDDGACPYFWPIGDKHILLHFSHVSGGKYLLGDYDQQRDKFVVTDGGNFNHGPVGPGGVHAPSATPDGNGGVIAIFNMNPACRTEGWNQIMTLPMRLTLAPPAELDRLRIEPAGDIESLRGEHQRIEAMKLPANQEVVLESIRGNTLEIAAEIVSEQCDMIELKVLRSPDDEEFTRIAVHPYRGYRRRERPEGGNRTDSMITLDNTRSSILAEADTRPPEEARFMLDPDEPVKLRVFIDHSAVEVFVNGKQYLALRVYPGREDSLGVSLRARGRDAVLKSLDAWQMGTIYESGGSD